MCASVGWEEGSVGVAVCLGLDVMGVRLCRGGVLTTPSEEKRSFLAGLFQVKKCFQNPEVEARLSAASCRAVGRTGLGAGGGGRQAFSLQGPQTHFIAGHTCQGQASWA